jgi:hypothetical protein
MPSIDAHEEFPATSGFSRCSASSTGWTDPIPQSKWGFWTTLGTDSSQDLVGTFDDDIIDACASGGCAPQPFYSDNATPSTTPLVYTPQFIFVGSRDTQQLGKYLSASPNMQVRYVDHGTDETGTWTCPVQ